MSASISSRVVTCNPDGSTPLATREVPSPGRGEIVLKLIACGLCGTDLYKIRTKSVPHGTVLGHELVGIVEATGDGVTEFAIGDRVVVPHHVACGECALCLRGSDTLCPTFKENLLQPGGFSEHILVHERATRLAARKLPDSLSTEAALFMEPAACVLRGIRRSGLLEWTDTLPKHIGIIGGGSMGLLHLLVIRAVAPDALVTVFDLREDRRQLARESGAARGEDPRSFGDAREFDLFFDTVGGAGPLGFALGRLRDGGSVVLFAHAKPAETAGFELNPFFKGEQRVIATYSGSLADQKEIFDLLVSGKLEPSILVTHRLTFDEFPEAVRIAENQEALKAVIYSDAALQPKEK